MENVTDRKIISCNLAVPTKTARKGAKAILGVTSGGALGDGRAQLLIRSRGGRYIEKWEPIKRLTNFRIQTLPPESPLYNDDRVMDFRDAESAEKELKYLLVQTQDVVL